MESVFKEQFKDKTDPISSDDKVTQLFEDDRFNVYAVMRSGRIFFKRAKGTSGAYDNWREVDLIAEINLDLRK